MIVAKEEGSAGVPTVYSNKTGRLLIWMLLVGIITAAAGGMISQAYRKGQLNRRTTMLLTNFRPYVLTKEAEAALKPGVAFRECAKDCPETTVVPSGAFMMGTPRARRAATATRGHNRTSRLPGHSPSRGLM